MAKSRVALRGRSMVALVLVAFVLLTSLVIWRRSVGISGARELRELGQMRLQLEGDRARLARDIRAASSRERLVPVAEQRLGMRVPSDDQMIILERRGDGAAAP
jgi:cell division protein FtsL